MYPDELAERDWTDESIGPQQDEERINNLKIRFIGVNKVVVNRTIDTPHWSELPKPVNNWDGGRFDEGDTSWDHVEEQGYDNEEE